MHEKYNFENIHAELAIFNNKFTESANGGGCIIKFDIL